MWKVRIADDEARLYSREQRSDVRDYPGDADLSERSDSVVGIRRANRYSYGDGSVGIGSLVDACGKPVLGARISGISEMIRPGETGQMFESGSSDDLARVLRQYVDMPDAGVEAQGREGRFWVERDFTVQTHVSRLLDAYRLAGVSIEA